MTHGSDENKDDRPPSLVDRVRSALSRLRELASGNLSPDLTSSSNGALYTDRTGIWKTESCGPAPFGKSEENHAISFIQWNERHTQVERCQIHLIEIDSTGNFSLSDGRNVHYLEVARLIGDGENVWVVSVLSEGNFHLGELVEAAGDGSYLFSRTNELLELPDLASPI